jgi:hypothetical protein
VTPAILLLFASFFDARVAPILTRRCLGCHNDAMKDGGLSFQTPDTLLKGGAHGPAIVPGDPEKSYLIHAIHWEDDIKMPPGPRLSDKEIKTLTEWIKRGAPWGRKLQ